VSVIEQELRSLIRALNVRLEVVDSIPSTHAALLAAASSSALQVLLANTQTQGRGRGGRVWQSPPNAALYLSMRASAEVSAASLSGLSVALGLAAWDALRQLGADQRLRLKWPNDLVADGNKLGGILVDLQSEQGSVAVVASIGINIDLPEALQIDQPHTDLRHAFPTIAWSKVSVAAALIDAWIEVLTTLNDGAWRRYLARFDEADALRGRNIQPRGFASSGIASGIDELGRLVLDCQGQRKAVTTVDWL